MASVAQAPASPLSSPRLPSPPPFPEVQLPPTSSSPGASADPGSQDANKELGEDTSATRRIRPGTKAADMATGPPLVQLSEVRLSRNAPNTGHSLEGYHLTQIS